MKHLRFEPEKDGFYGAYWECDRQTDCAMILMLGDDSEAAHPHTKEEMIPVENIKGRLLLMGAEDDALWDTAKYIRRMEERLDRMPHECKQEIVVYEHGTHFIFPESMIKIFLPVGSDLFVRFAFKAAKAYPKECKATRLDVDRRMREAIDGWTKE